MSGTEPKMCVAVDNICEIAKLRNCEIANLPVDCADATTAARERSELGFVRCQRYVWQFRASPSGHCWSHAAFLPP